MTQKRPITPFGYNLLRKELRQLKGMRPELANAIERARELGDLRENADYEVAKKHSGMVEAKIKDLEVKLTMAEIIQKSQIENSKRVVFGLTAHLEDVDTGTEKVYTVVGEDESDLADGRVSMESPIAKALIGKEIGDIAKVQAPGGAKEYEVVNLSVRDDLYVVTLEEEPSL